EAYTPTPPAVRGRDRAALTGACAAPVLVPLCWPRVCAGSVFCAAPAPTSSDRQTVQMATNRAINRQCKANWLETTDGIRHRLPGLASSHTVGSDIQPAGSGFVGSCAANVFAPS